jgi:hypothetical protein
MGAEGGFVTRLSGQIRSLHLLHGSIHQRDVTDLLVFSYKTFSSFIFGRVKLKANSRATQVRHLADKQSCSVLLNDERVHMLKHRSHSSALLRSSVLYPFLFLSFFSTFKLFLIFFSLLLLAPLLTQLFVYSLFYPSFLFLFPRLSALILLLHVDRVGLCL